MFLPKKIQNQIKKYPAFYQKVWHACTQIPKGETRTYGWIAKQIGSPRAARAVGQALAKNPFAPTVPCHRVVRSDGNIGGYSGAGGIQKKKFFLERERRKKNKEARNTLFAKFREITPTFSPPHERGDSEGADSEIREPAHPAIAGCFATGEPPRKRVFQAKKAGDRRSERQSQVVQ